MLSRFRAILAPVGSTHMERCLPPVPHRSRVGGEGLLLTSVVGVLHGQGVRKVRTGGGQRRLDGRQIGYPVPGQTNPEAGGCNAHGQAGSSVADGCGVRGKGLFFPAEVVVLDCKGV